jgi:hypothetical protein
LTWDHWSPSHPAEDQAKYHGAAVIDAVASMQAIDNPELTKAALTVREKLSRVIELLDEGASLQELRKDGRDSVKRGVGHANVWHALLHMNWILCGKCLPHPSDNGCRWHSA